MYFEFPKGGHFPVRSHETRWVTHKGKALQCVLDRYGAYIHHHSTLTEDSSLKSDDRQRLKGYHLKWKQPKIGCAMYVEALKPVSLLSLTLQKDGADIVISIENTLKSVLVRAGSNWMAHWYVGEEEVKGCWWPEGVSRSTSTDLWQYLGAVQEACDGRHL